MHDMAKRCRTLVIPLILMAGLLSFSASRTWGLTVRVDVQRRIGAVRPLHGVNNGPLDFGGLIDLTESYRRIAVPHIRLHDCEWPDPDLVDIHAIFPDMTKPADRPESYRFAKTDAYLAAATRTGAKMVYRLGESIEHTRRKYYVEPPTDPDQWAAVCVGIIRHYTQGWADGYRYDIPYWEIWNEPENRPNMWTGTDEDYYRLYTVAARRIKAAFPHLRVGGPAVGAPGQFVDERFIPSPFLQGFLRHCRQQEAPLDFFSWHTYSADPFVYGRRARAIRAWLDASGFENTELHLNEWNYLPDEDWSAISLTSQGPARQRWFARQGGPEGAAFLTAVLIDLQDSPTDVANYYSGDTNLFGLFNRYGTPKKTWYAMAAFARLIETPHRVQVVHDRPGHVTVCAATDVARTRLNVLMAVLDGGETEATLHVSGLDPTGPRPWSILRVDADHDLEPSVIGNLTDEPLRLENLHGPCVVLLHVGPAPTHR